MHAIEFFTLIGLMSLSRAVNAQSDMHSNSAGEDPDDWERIDTFWPYCALIVVNIFILGPISIILTAKYYEKRNDDMYHTRRPELVTILNWASIFIIMIYLPLHIGVFEILLDNNGDWREWYVQSILFLSIRRIVIYFVFSESNLRSVLLIGTKLLRTGQCCTSSTN